MGLVSEESGVLQAGTLRLSDSGLPLCDGKTENKKAKKRGQFCAASSSDPNVNLGKS